MRFDYKTHDTPQQIFDAAIEFFKTQKQQSYDKEQDSCMYRLDETPECEITCVVGAFMPNEAYTPFLEQKGVTMIGADVRDDAFGSWLLRHRSLLSYLQNAHDTDTSWDEEGFWNWTALRDVAHNFNLNTSNIPESK